MLSFLNVTKNFLNDILHHVEVERCKGTHLLVGDKGKISYLLASCFELVLFVVNMPVTRNI